MKLLDDFIRRKRILIAALGMIDRLLKTNAVLHMNGNVHLMPT